MIPNTPYFLVKVKRVIEKETKAKIGSIIIPENLSFMQFNTQCGEIVGIGSGAADYFPEAKTGHTLLMHHFCQSENESDARIDHLVHQDKDYNYYVVTAYECAGKNVETYGVWDGQTIIPNKDYIFLQIENNKTDNLTPDELINQALEKTDTGLFLFKKWEESRERKEERQAEIKRQVESLSKSGNHKPHVQQAILQKEAEMEIISREINKKTYLPFKVAFHNKELLNHFGNKKELNKGDYLYILNIAASTLIKFNDIEYVVAKTKYIGFFLAV